MATAEAHASRRSYEPVPRRKNGLWWWWQQTCRPCKLLLDNKDEMELVCETSHTEVAACKSPGAAVLDSCSSGTDVQHATLREAEYRQAAVGHGRIIGSRCTVAGGRIRNLDRSQLPQLSICTGPSLSKGRNRGLISWRTRRCGGNTALALVLGMVIWSWGFMECINAQAAHHADILAVNDLSSKFAAVVRSAACNSLYTGGVGCERTGFQDLLQQLHKKTGAYKPVEIRLDDMLMDDLLPQIEGVFLNASRMLITLRDHMEDLIIKGHRIETLTGRDLSLLPKWDATHPRWKNATDLVANNKTFDKPVIKESSLKYPAYVSPGERRVMIAANASSGLDEYFAENLLNPHNKYLRWQRFVSNTGMTRQFPGTYDVAEYDNRLAPWYKMATQTPKRIIFLLDLSESMLAEKKIEIAKTTVLTLLDSLIPEDYVNVVFVDDDETVPHCFPEALTPASPNNIDELKRFVTSASIGAADKIFGAFDKAEELLKKTDELVSREEKLRVPDYLKNTASGITAKEQQQSETACRGHRCTALREYIMLVSDGIFQLDQSIIGQMDLLSSRRPLLHTLSIAVGESVNKRNMVQISCALQGLFFHISPIHAHENWANDSWTDAEKVVIHESYVLNEMNEYFQMVAAPLARNHSILNGNKFDPSKPLHNLSLDVTWSMPMLDSRNEAVVTTISLPCFGDSDKHTPRLVGVVAIDLLFLLPGERFGSSLMSYFYDIEKNEPVDGLMDLAIVFKSGYVGWSLVDSNLMSEYEKGVDNMTQFQIPGHYHYLDYLGVKDNALIRRILSEPAGYESLVLDKNLPINAQQWMNEPLRSESTDITCAWMHVPGHPFVLVLVAKGKANSNGVNIFMRFEPSVSSPAACTNNSGPGDLCWNVEATNLLAYDPARATESFLYLPKISYQKTAIYLQEDAMVLPPKCSEAFTLKCPGSKRIQALMNSLKALKHPTETTMSGSGLTLNGFKDVILSSLVELFWAQIFSRNETLVKRVFMSTTRGVYRTRLNPGKNATRDLHVPFLYAPQTESWYHRAQGVQGRVVLSAPTIKQGIDGESSIIISQAVRHGYIEDQNPDHRLANTAAVLGAELDYDVLHDKLYGKNKLTGKGKQSVSICEANNLLCFVVDEAAMLLFHPQKEVFSGAQARGKRSTFFGEFEPSLMEALVFHKVFQKVEKESVVVASKSAASVLGYEINTQKLPLELRLSGETRGFLYMSAMPGTNAIFMALEQYQSKPKLQGCGLLSTQCPNAHLPVITPTDSHMCGINLQRHVYMVSGVQPQLPDFDFTHIVAAMQMIFNCPMVFPQWIPWVLLGIGCILFIVLSLMGVKYVTYHRRRQEYLEQFQVFHEGGSSAAMHSRFKQYKDPREKRLLQTISETRDCFAMAQQLDFNARTFDDYRQLIQFQAGLIEAVSDQKHLTREVDGEHLRFLANKLLSLRVLAGNLDTRLKKEEAGGAMSNVQQLQTQLNMLRNRFTELQKGLESVMLPTVNIDKNVGDMLFVCDDPDEQEQNQALDTKDIQAEEAFYQQFYPHLIQYETPLDENEEALRSQYGDATEMSLMTERSINDKAVQEAREQLRKSFKGSAMSTVLAARGAAIFEGKKYKQ